MVIHELHEDEKSGWGSEGAVKVSGLVSQYRGGCGSSQFEGDNDDIPVEVLVVNLPELFELIGILAHVPLFVEVDVFEGE